MEQKKESLFVSLLKEPSWIPIVLLVRIFGGAYRVFFSWWLDDYVAKRSRQRFKSQIRDDLGFLFDTYHAEFVPNNVEPPPKFDWTKATLNVDNMTVMITRDHNIVGVHVAPMHAPGDWLELSAVIAVIRAAGGSEAEVEFARLPTIATLLKSEMASLTQALSSTNFENTKRAVANICKSRSIQARLNLEKELSERRKQLGLSRWR